MAIPRTCRFLDFVFLDSSRFKILFRSQTHESSEPSGRRQRNKKRPQLNSMLLALWFPLSENMVNVTVCIAASCLRSQGKSHVRVASDEGVHSLVVMVLLCICPRFWVLGMKVRSFSTCADTCPQKKSRHVQQAEATNLRQLRHFCA